MDTDLKLGPEANSGQNGHILICGKEDMAADTEIALKRDAAMDAARRYAHHSRAESTWRTYESAWRIFEIWCSTVSLSALPAAPDTVAMFIGAQADEGLAPATLAHRLAAIRLMHLGQGLPSPHNTLAVMEVMRGIRRQRAKAGEGTEKKAPAVDAIIKRMVDQLDTETLRGKRDRALLLYGYAGALRRSEIVGIDVHHIEAHERGHLLTIPISKGDQEGRGQTIGILAQPDSPYCPVAAIQAWIVAGRITAGAVFRRFYRSDVLSDKRLGDRAVADLIKDAVYRLKDPSLDYHQFSGHSLRRGFLTSAGRNKADLLKMIAQSRHARVDTVLDYVDDQHRFENHAGEHLLKSDFEQQSCDTPSRDDR